MIDPINSLAFSIQANKGVYALLLGSGISRAAKIPTGWEVTLDLVRKLSEICGESCESSPEEWYRTKFGCKPEYSEILGEIVKTPTERQQLLRRYWEPNDEEREEGLKQPTVAHRAIASLVEQGFIKVIVTTNFDRLMETALAEVGITPTVLSTPDQVIGSLPLIHTRCCVFKINGDYLDARIRNTTEELSAYPSEFDSLLDRIFDEFGLIICGWSAEWDEALCSAMYRAPSRRFTTYWALRGEPKEQAEKIIHHRQAQVIPIADANTFFHSLQEQIQSIEEYSKPHPLSKEAAVASIKRYMSEPRFNIKFSDLVADQVERAVKMIETCNFSLNEPKPESTSFTYRVRSYESTCSLLIAISSVGAFWAKEEHYNVWQRALERLASRRENEGTVLWLDLQRYPATLLFYALGIGAVESGNLDFICRLFTTSVHQEYNETKPAVQLLPPYCLFQEISRIRGLLEGMEGRKFALNDWLNTVLREHFQNLIPSEKRYTLMFDKFEILIALGYVYHAKRIRMTDDYWAPPGAFVYRHNNCELILKEIRESIILYGNQSPCVRSNIFGEDSEKCNKSIDSLMEFVKKIDRPWL
jgi:hypothetical protein